MTSLLLMIGKASSTFFHPQPGAGRTTLQDPRTKRPRKPRCRRAPSASTGSPPDAGRVVEAELGDLRTGGVHHTSHPRQDGRLEDHQEQMGEVRLEVGDLGLPQCLELIVAG